MGVRKKSRRKILCNGKRYVWYILTGDRDYWERVSLNDWNTAFLHIISEDKSIVLTIPLGAPVPYVVSKGRIFRGKPTSGGWERYFLPFDHIPESVTPRFVSEVIEWAENGESEDAIPQKWGGKLQY